MWVNNYILFREILSFLLFLDLVFYTPYFNIFFGSGYNKKGFLTYPFSLFIIYSLWASSLIAIFIGYKPLIASFILLVIFRHYFINNRWKSIFRGGGAPGFMSHYSMLYIFLFELSFYLDHTLNLSNYILLIYRVDLSLIMICAGLYKSLAGYLKNEGMEYGVSNPLWGYHFQLFKSLNCNSLFFKIQNWFGSIGELIIGILLLIPNKSVQAVGAVGFIICFLYVIPTVRLGRLAFILITLPILFLPDLGFVFITKHIPLIDHKINGFSLALFKALVLFYVFTLPVIKIMQYYNLFFNKRFFSILQTILTKLSNVIPIIIWRVFTADIINFFIRIYQVDHKGNIKKIILDERTTYSYKEWNNLYLKCRFLSVTESITITSIFSTLKYFKSKRALFEEKLLRYAKTLQTDKESLLMFQYVSIQKIDNNFEYIPVTNFSVDVNKNSIIEQIIDNNFDYTKKALYSPIRESESFGSYLKK